MTLLPRPRTSFWRDIRFLVGVALVALSIGGVWLIVSAAGRTTPVLQASRTIVQGEALVSADFRVVDVGLGQLTDGYLAPQDLEPGAVAARTLAEGELMPASALGSADSARTTTIVIESGTGIPAGVKAGTIVELWQAPPLDDARTFDIPRILVGDVIISEVVESQGMLANDTTQVEVVVDRADVADVLAAITGGSLLSVVPVGSGS